MSQSNQASLTMIYSDYTTNAYYIRDYIGDYYYYIPLEESQFRLG